MENVLEIISFLDDQDKKLRKEIEVRRGEIAKGEVLSHEEIWQGIDKNQKGRL